MPCSRVYTNIFLHVFNTGSEYSTTWKWVFNLCNCDYTEIVTENEFATQLFFPFQLENGENF